MPFSEATKLEAKRRAHFKCVICQESFVQVHHILPQKLGGSDEVDNAAPLCGSCHTRYGGNPDTQKQIREMRDFWWELCAKREQRLPEEWFERFDRLRIAFEALLAAPVASVELANQRETMANLRALAIAIESYAIDHNAYPAASTIEELRDMLEPVYTRAMPTIDGWGRPLLVVSDKATYSVRSLGRNGRLDNGGGGPTSSPDANIIFSDGQFTQWPEEYSN